MIDFMAKDVDFANMTGPYCGGTTAKRKAQEQWKRLKFQLQFHGSDKGIQQWKCVRCVFSLLSSITSLNVFIFLDFLKVFLYVPT